MDDSGVDPFAGLLFRLVEVCGIWMGCCSCRGGCEALIARVGKAGLGGKEVISSGILS